MTLRQLPSIASLLADPRLLAVSRALAVRAAREVVEEARTALKEGKEIPSDLGALVLARSTTLGRSHLRRVVNATGIVLHTNLGRAPLAPEAVAALVAVAAGYSNTELDLETGLRGGRLAGVAPLICELTGAEAALVVNNNAAGVLLTLTALAAAREVVVSRGELVEIGGGFRVPEIIASGGARLVEVGTTNRTRVGDFAAAITPNTALLLRVHPSNFRMLGFVERPDRAALAALAHAHGLPLVDDLGSGALPPPIPGVDPEDAEPVDRALADGVDLVCFSCDKLLGGPQAGVIAGRRDLVARLAAHPLMRALRVDKLVLAALEATLRLYQAGRADAVPVRAMLARDVEQGRAVATRIAAAVAGAVIEEDVGYAGGGALPARGLASVVVALRGGDPEGRAARLRAGSPPILARVARNALIVDPRTLLDGEEEIVIAALGRLAAEE